MRRNANRETWFNVGQYRACIAHDEGKVCFSVHGKNDIRGGFVRPVVVARGWIDDDNVRYLAKSDAFNVELERELITAARRSLIAVAK